MISFLFFLWLCRRILNHVLCNVFISSLIILLNFFISLSSIFKLIGQVLQRSENLNILHLQYPINTLNRLNLAIIQIHRFQLRNPFYKFRDNRYFIIAQIDSNQRLQLSQPLRQLFNTIEVSLYLFEFFHLCHLRREDRD